MQTAESVRRAGENAAAAATQPSKVPLHSAADTFTTLPNEFTLTCRKILFKLFKVLNLHSAACLVHNKLVIGLNYDFS